MKNEILIYTLWAVQALCLIVIVCYVLTMERRLKRRYDMMAKAQRSVPWTRKVSLGTTDRLTDEAVRERVRSGIDGPFAGAVFQVLDDAVMELYDEARNPAAPEPEVRAALGGADALHLLKAELADMAKPDEGEGQGTEGEGEAA